MYKFITNQCLICARMALGVLLLLAQQLTILQLDKLQLRHVKESYSREIKYNIVYTMLIF